MTPSQKKWLTGCGVMLGMVLLLAIATVVTLAASCESLTREVHQGIEQNQTETFSALFGDLPEGYRTVIGFSVPGSARFGAIRDDRYITMAGEQPAKPPQQFLKILKGSPAEAEKAASEYLVGMNYSRKQTLHYRERYSLETAKGLQGAAAFLGVTSRKKDGVIPILVAPLAYQDDRHIILFHYPLRPMENDPDELKTVFQQMTGTMAEVINRTRLSAELIPISLSETTGEKTAGK